MILRALQPKVIAIAAAAILVLAGVGWALSHAWSGARDGHTGGAAKQLWTCSMHPHVLKDKPGPCPICHMPLTLVKSHQLKPAAAGKSKLGKADNALLIRVEPSVIQKMGVRTEIVKKDTIERELRGVAHIEFNEKNQTIINSRVNGWVEKLYARFTGQTVRRGQALAGIYSPDLVSTQQEYLELYKQIRAGQALGQPSPEMAKLLTAARRRLRLWNISPAQIRQIEKSGKVTRLLTLYSPYSGVIIEKKVVQGSRIKVGSDLFKVVDLSTVWAFVHVPEKDIPFVRVGMPASMVVPQVPGKVFKGRVSFVFPFLDRKTRDLKIRVSFRNPRFQLRPGMYATLIARRRLPGRHVVVPLSAVIRTGSRSIAFVYKGEGVFEPREVLTGVTTGDSRLQILNGVRAGEAIVVSGQFLLDSESRIQEAVRKLRAGGMRSRSTGGHKH